MTLQCYITKHPQLVMLGHRAIAVRLSQTRRRITIGITKPTQISVILGHRAEDLQISHEIEKLRIRQILGTGPEDDAWKVEKLKTQLPR